MLQDGVMSAHVSPAPRRPGDLLPFLLLSLLAHGLLLAWLSMEPLTLVEEPEPPPIVVQLDSPPPPEQEEGLPAHAQNQLARTAPDKQIVAPSDQENEIAPEGPAFLSDRDNSVEQQTIRRGNPDAGAQNVAEAEEVSPAPEAAPPPEPEAVAEPKPEPAPAEPAPEPEPVAEPKAAPRPAREAAKPLPGLDRLFAPPSQVLAKARTQPSQPSQPRANTKPAANADPHRDLLSAPPPVPGVLSGLRGSFDSLPDVAAGQLTMLNTKADRYAPFVRRVGTRVFQNLLIYQRRDLDAPDILAATQLVTVRALLDSTGKLKSLEVVDRSGSPAMDRTLVEALRQAAFDPNPPSGAANLDGDFEFIFQAQILASVQPGLNDRIRAVESRLRIGLM